MCPAAVSSKQELQNERKPSTSTQRFQAKQLETTRQVRMQNEWVAHNLQSSSLDVSFRDFFWAVFPFHFLNTLQGTNISPDQGMFENEFPFPRVRYVSFLEGISFSILTAFLYHLFRCVQVSLCRFNSRPRSFYHTFSRGKKWEKQVKPTKAKPISSKDSTRY